MDYIKEYCPHYSSVIIRTNTHAHSFRHFENLLRIAKNDFPGIATENIEVIHYGGDTHKGQYGIEFCWEGIIPDEYTKVYDTIQCQ